MNINCDNCLVAVKDKLSGLPSGWRDSIASAICDAFSGSYQELDCEAIKECINGQLGSTSLSEFTVDGSTISISYTDVNEVTVTRSFDFTEIINNSINNIDPNCLASAEDWSAMSYLEKWQAIVDKVCDTCVDASTTTTTTV